MAVRSGGRARLARWALGLVAAVGLAACADGPATEPADASQAAEPAALAPGLSPGDVEAPEVFQVTAEGLWDGRPSLGGVWVAHPDVAEPERVVVRNGDSGQAVTAALFRRERDAPGPALQVSSEAAEALGMLAGAPATLEVVALRREEPPADGAAAEPAASEGTAPDANALDTTADEAADAPAPPEDPAAGALADGPATSS